MADSFIPESRARRRITEKYVSFRKIPENFDNSRLFGIKEKIASTFFVERSNPPKSCSDVECFHDDT